MYTIKGIQKLFKKDWEQKGDQMNQIKYDENDLQIGDRCLEILNYNVESAAYLNFFDHCPWCRSKDILLRVLCASSEAGGDILLTHLPA